MTRNDTIDRRKIDRCKRARGWRSFGGQVLLSFKHIEKEPFSCRYRTEVWKEGRVVEIIPGEEGVKALTVDVIPKWENKETETEPQGVNLESKPMFIYGCSRSE